MSESFNVFLSHNSQDRPIVRKLAQALKAYDLLVWLDEEQLVPGRPWQEALETIIQTTQAAVVLIGESGLGPWEDPEMRACLSEFVKRKLPVIPLLLPGTPAAPKLPLFLQSFTWVDLRDGLTDLGLEKLVWGITGVKQTKPASGRRDTPIKNYKKNRIFKELLGNYILYFPRPHQSENDFIKSPLKIYSSLNGKLKAELKIREFLYKGIVEIHDGTIFIDLISSYSKTHFVAYLVRKIGIHTVLEGVHLSRSRRRMPIVSKIIAEETPFEFEYTDSEFVYKTNLPDDIKEYFNSKNLIIYQFIQTE